MSEFLLHFKRAARALSQRPAFALVVILSLGMAIGANTAVFSLIHAVLLKDLPFKDAERVYLIWNQFPAQNQLKASFSLPEFADLRERASAFSEVATTRPGLANLTGDGDPELLVIVRSSANLFDLLGVKPALGRAFVAEEETPGRERVVVISHALWARRFGSRPDVLGRQVTLDGQPYEVIGVLPQDFHFRRKGRDLWVPAVIDRTTARDDRWFEAYGRLKPGVTPEAALADLKAVAARLAQDYPDTYGKTGGYTMGLVSYSEEVVGAIRSALLVLAAGVGLVLLIACANVANLLLARATTREREVALRAALGAGRGQLIRQFLAEGMLLSLGGAVLGAVLAFFSVRFMVKLNPGRLPRVDEAGIDGVTLLFTLGLMLLTGLFFGLVPALRVGRKDFHAILKEGGKGSASGAHKLARKGLVVVEVAIALLVLMGASLLVTSLSKLQNVKPGFDPDGLLTLELRLPRDKYATPEQAVNFYRDLMPKLEALPSASAATAINAIPLGVVERTGDLEVEGRAVAPGEPYPNAAWRITIPGYARTLGIPVLEGREFSNLDLAASEPVALVDKKLADQLWPGESALGKRFRLIGQAAPNNYRAVVGVLGNAKHDKMESDANPTVYVPLPQFPQWFMYMAVRTSGDAAALAEPVRQAVKEVDRNQSIFRVETMRQKLDNVLAWRRFYTFLLACFSLVALVLAVVGVYSLMAYQAAERTREIGIRIALGAPTASVKSLMLREGLGLAGLGVGVGLVVALISVKGVSSLLYGISAFSPIAFLAVTAAVMGLGLLASWLPARRAMKVDPKVALSAE